MKPSRKQSPEERREVYARPVDFLDDDELEKMKPKNRIKPLKDRPLSIKVHFAVDVGKIEGVTTSLDRRELPAGSSDDGGKGGEAKPEGDMFEAPS